MARPKLSPWKVLESRALIEKKWLSVHEQRIELAHGATIDSFHLITAPSWTGVLCITESDQVVMVRQYRHGLGGESLELPAGVLEPGESPEQAARRELLEETGFSAEQWQPLMEVATEPARHTTRAHFFCAFGARRVAEPRLDESEHLEATLVPRGELAARAERGDIVHGVHVAAILLAARRGYL